MKTLGEKVVFVPCQGGLLSDMTPKMIISLLYICTYGCLKIQIQNNSEVPGWDGKKAI